MAFSWVEDVSVGASIDVADVNEVKTNLDSIYTALGITRGGCASGAGWTELPVSPGDAITSAQFQQMRDATDYAYDNKCPAYNSTYNSGVQTSNLSGYCGGECSGALMLQHSGVQSGYNSGVNSGYCPGFVT